MSFKAWWHALLLSLIPMIGQFLLPYITAAHLPMLAELRIEGIVLLSVVIGYATKLAWMGSSPTFSLLHSIVVVILTSVINAVVTIMSTGAWPTQAQWTSIFVFAGTMAISYIGKFYGFGSSIATPPAPAPSNIRAAGTP